MEYERFFHFSDDKYAAKWYLLTGSCAVPQRLLCQKRYAEKKKFVNFGNYRIGKDDYCYVILNIFEIPFNELENFFILKCDKMNNYAPRGVITDDFDVNFKKIFISSHEKTPLTLNINVDETSDNYLSGIQNMMTPQIMDVNLKINTMSCSSSYEPTQQYPRSDLNLFRKDNNKRRLDHLIDMSDAPQAKIVASTNNQLDDDRNFIAQNDIFGTATNNNDSMEVDQVVDITDDEQMFPSTSRQQGYFPDVEDKDVSLDFNTLTNLGRTILESNRNDWFAEIYDGHAEIKNGQLIIVNRDQSQHSHSLDRNVLERFNEATRLNKLIYPTFLTESQKQSILSRLGEQRLIKKFNDFVNTHGDQIIKIVESANDEEFEKNINDSNQPFYWSLYGLYKYMQNRNPSFTLYMEILVSRMYNTYITVGISELFIRIYFVAKKEAIVVKDNTINLFHLQNLELVDKEIDFILELMQTQNYLEKFKKLIPDIPNNYRMTVNNNSITSTNAYFANNLFPIDEYLYYIIEKEGVYLTTLNWLNRAKITSRNTLEKYSANKSLFSIFINKKYLGTASF